MFTPPPAPRDARYAGPAQEPHVPTQPQTVEHTLRLDVQTVLPRASDLAEALHTVRIFVAAGQREEARTLLHHLIARVPAYEQPWFQLLALDPPPAEELELLEGFVSHHPHHRFVSAFHARQEVVRETLRIVTLLHDIHPDTAPVPELAPPPMRLGEYLIAQGLVTPKQIAHVVAEQSRLRSLGIEERLGTLLLVDSDLTSDQLTTALNTATAKGFGVFGNYLVDSGWLTAAQASSALAQQTMAAAAAHRTYRQQLNVYQRRPIPALVAPTCPPTCPKAR